MTLACSSTRPVRLNKKLAEMPPATPQKFKMVTQTPLNSLEYPAEQEICVKVDKSPFSRPTSPPEHVIMMTKFLFVNNFLILKKKTFENSI